MAISTPDETLLGLIYAQRQHGYQLLDVFQKLDGLAIIWDMSTSQLYAVLKRLEKNGWVNGRQVTVENAPPRTEYRITETGVDTLFAWLNHAEPHDSIRGVRVEFLSRLYIAHLIGHPTEALVERQRDACENRLRELQHQRDAIEEKIPRLALELVIAQYDAVLRWFDQFILEIGVTS